MKKMHVLGLGPTLSTYRYDGCPTIGCNDIWSHHPVDYVVCIDKPARFSVHRLLAIQKGNQKKFFANAGEWENQVKNYEQIHLHPIRGDVSTLDKTSRVIPWSNNSAFCAAVLAYKLGATQILMHGVDFTDHHTLGKEDAIKKARIHFQALTIALLEKGVRLLISSPQSGLAGYVPVLAIPESRNQASDLTSPPYSC